MTPAQHIHISEREVDGTWEDCTFDAGLEWYRLTRDASKPATHAEAEELRRASGRAMTGGTNLGDFRKGVLARYEVTLQALVSNRTVLKPGQAAARQGSMSAFGPTHRLSKWQTNFDASHCVLEFKDLDGQLWWCDPLAPKTAAVPVKVTQAEVDAYAKAFDGMAIIGDIQNYTEAEVPLNTYLPGYTAEVKPGSNVRSEPRIASTKLHTTTEAMPVSVVGTVAGDKDPATGSTVWYELWHDGRVEYTAADNIVNLQPPPPTGPTYPDLSVELAAAQAANAELAARNAELQAKAYVGHLFTTAVRESAKLP